MCLQQNGYSSHSYFRCISFDQDVVLGNKKDLICLTNQLLIHSCCVFIYFSVVKLDAWIMSLIIFFFLISAKNTQAETTNPSSNNPNWPTTCFNRKGSSLSSANWALAKSSLLKWSILLDCFLSNLHLLVRLPYVDISFMEIVCVVYPWLWNCHDSEVEFWQPSCILSCCQACVRNQLKREQNFLNWYLRPRTFFL